MKWIAAMILMVMAGTACADGDRLVVPANAKWKEECSSCHVAYPPQLLDRADWGKLMSGLDRHFGVDASLEPAERNEILGFLQRHAGSGSRHSSSTQRISDTSWFIHEHREVSSLTWSNPAIKTRSNCTACHVRAERGDWSERSIRVPGHFEDEDDD
jgi:phage-related protein